MKENKITQEVSSFPLHSVFSHKKIIKKEVDENIDKHDKILYTICALTLIISIKAFYR